MERQPVFGNRKTVRLGTLIGLGIAAILSGIAWVYWQFEGADAARSTGLTLELLVAAYFASGAFGGFLFGAFAPLLGHKIAAPLLGFVGALPMMAILAASMMPPESSVTARVVVAAIAALSFGGGSMAIVRKGE